MADGGVGGAGAGAGAGAVEALLLTAEGREEIRQLLMPQLTDQTAIAKLERQMTAAEANEAQHTTKSHASAAETDQPQIQVPEEAPSHVEEGEDREATEATRMDTTGDEPQASLPDMAAVSVLDAAEDEEHQPSSPAMHEDAPSLSPVASGEQLHILAPISAGGKIYARVLPIPNIESHPSAPDVRPRRPTEESQPSAPTLDAPTPDPVDLTSATTNPSPKKPLRTYAQLAGGLLLRAIKFLLPLLTILYIILHLLLTHTPLTLCPRTPSNLPHTSLSHTILPPTYTTTNSSVGTQAELTTLRTAAHLLLASHASCPPSQRATFALDGWIGAIDGYLASGALSNPTGLYGYGAVGVVEAVSRLLPPLIMEGKSEEAGWLMVFDSVVGWTGRVSWGSQKPWHAGVSGLRGGVVEVLGRVVEGAVR